MRRSLLLIAGAERVRCSSLIDSPVLSALKVLCGVRVGAQLERFSPASRPSDYTSPSYSGARKRAALLFALWLVIAAKGG